MDERRRLVANLDSQAEELPQIGPRGPVDQGMVRLAGEQQGDLDAPERGASRAQGCGRRPKRASRSERAQRGPQC